MTVSPLRRRQAASPTPGLAGPLTGGSAPALVCGDTVLTHDDLEARIARRVATWRWAWGAGRRLLLLEAAAHPEFVVAYLAALRARHPVVLVPAGEAEHERWSELRARFEPDAYLTAATGWADPAQTPPVRLAEDLHPELALLLTTSGSTGSPKLVRLSRRNLDANAAAIAESLGLRPDDVGALSLPLHYCYGLSVLHSHLVSGAAVWMPEAGVGEERFWHEAERAGITGFSGVPHSFDLIEAIGAARQLPRTLRRVTQAGGRFAPHRVRAWAARGREQGFDFVVMYGATEATARMAYLPPDLAASHPDCIGIPVPGGSFRVDDGELCFRGDNVMMGYATSATDLALGHELDELRTGDLAEQDDSGLWRIVGRRSRRAKVFGHRIDLDRVERLLHDAGVTCGVVEVEGQVAVGVLARQDAAVDVVRTVHATVGRSVGLPAFAYRVVPLSELPRTGSGKLDYDALGGVVAGHTEPAPAADDVRGVMALVLGRPDARDSDTFAGLGGDSLSYVEASSRLEALLGPLPRDWAQRSIGDLSATRRPRRRRWLRTMETPTLLRALAIVLIVGTHTEWWDVMGGAHVLLGIVGYNLGRFALALCESGEPGERGERARRVLASLREMLVPTLIWVLGVSLVMGFYQWPAWLFLNTVVGDPRWDNNWQLWFLEPVVWGMLAIAALVAIPWVDRFDLRRPFLAACLVLAATLVLRWTLTGQLAAELDRYRLPIVLWCVALGLVIARATTPAQRVLATCLVGVGYIGFFADPHRESVIIVGLALLIWLPAVPMPSVLVAPISWLSAASLFIFLTHWVVYRPLDANHDELAALASYGVGVAVWAGYAAVRARLRKRAGSGRGPVAAFPA